MTMKKAVCYYRTFLPEDKFGAHTIKQQKTECKEYAKINRLKVVAEFHDVDIRGTDQFNQRPAYSAMMKFVADNDTDVLLTQHTNRLAQHIELQLLAHLRLQYRGVDYVPLDCATAFTDVTPYGEFAGNMITCLNQFAEATRANGEGREIGEPLTEDDLVELSLLNSILPHPPVPSKEQLRLERLFKAKKAKRDALPRQPFNARTAKALAAARK